MKSQKKALPCIYVVAVGIVDFLLDSTVGLILKVLYEFQLNDLLKHVTLF